MTDRDGRVHASVPGLADRAKVSLADCQAALETFRNPDEWSRSKVEEGRRIREIPGGWEIINYREYRNLMSKEERREYQRVKQAEYRSKQKESVAQRKRRLDAEDRERRYVAAAGAGDEAKAARIAAEGLPEQATMEDMMQGPGNEKGQR